MAHISTSRFALAAQHPAPSSSSSSSSSSAPSSSAASSSHASFSSTAQSAAGSSATAAPVPSISEHPAIRHLHQLHPQLDDEQLQAIAYEALHPPHASTHVFPSAHPTFPPLSVVACPGSGKTLTLAARIAFFISYHRLPASRILAITFTRKAKAELLERVRGILQHERTAAQAAGRPPPSFDVPQVRTFGSLALQYVRKYGHKFGWRSTLRVLKDGEVKRILRDIVQEAQAAARQKMTAAELAQLQVPDEEPVKHEAAAAEEDKEGERWGHDDVDEDEMLRLLESVEAKQSSEPTAANQPPPAATVPALTSALRTKPFSTAREQERFVNNAYDYIKRVRLRAGLTLKPATAHLPATLHTASHYKAADSDRLTEDDAVIMHEMLRAYDARLHAAAQLNQADFIPALLALLRADEAVLREVQSEWRAVFCDEVQDSSRSDIALVLAMVGCARWTEVERSGQDKLIKPLTARPAGQPRALTAHLSFVGDRQLT